MTSTRAGQTGGLRSRAVSGVVWTVSQQWSIRITGFVTIAILTRLLSPAEFGTVALASSMIPFVQLVANMGLTTYLVQRDRPSDATFDTVFWYTGAVSLALAGGMVAAGPFIGAFFDVDELGPVVQLLAVVGPIALLGMVPTVLLRRALRFRTIALQSVVAGAIGQVVAITLALLGAGVWALVWQTITFQAVLTVLAWASARWHPSWSFSSTELADMIRFGVKVVGGDVVALVRGWLENVIVVAALGVTGLGYLNIAQRLVQVAHDLTTTPVTWVSMVIFAQIREAVDRLRAAYLRAQYLAHAMVVPVMVGLAVGSSLLLPLLFGDQWEQSIGPAQILALAGIVTLSGLDNGLFIGLGRPGTWLVYVAIVDAVTIGVAWLTAPHGLVAFALGFLCVAVLATVARWFLVSRLLETSWWVIGKTLVRVLVPAAGAGAAGTAIVLVMEDTAPLLTLAVACVVVIAVYLPLIRFMLPAVWAELRDLIRAAVRRIRPKERESS
ncbi:lipopolysaccharide biosynthesis protein [Microbacterium sp. 18062]|uniref:lipopolysaccharide biosynthesis protein n=1 Tax=Microbacterium sp. 18062 TaxID=2681410 RepID=UPI001356E412|nr:lipopolysaccharide biosynthesis protein [Microbacterium sp. 18062]